MIGILIGIILLLLGVLLSKYMKEKEQKRQIAYLLDKVEMIMKEKSQERILIPTENEEIKKLANVMNQLLEYDRKNEIQYARSKQSIKTMLANVSHDLKTPLTVIMGYLEMLSIRNEEEKTIAILNEKVKELLQLIQKFFDLAKLESGDKKVICTPLNVCEICRQNLFTFFELLEKEAFQVEVEIPEKNIICLLNEEALGRVLHNIISNAIRYGKDGRFLGVKIEEKEKIVAIHIMDHGKGIKEQYQEEVFERLYTLEDSRSKEYQGSGLGLTITKELVEQMKGTITLKSEPYVETRFTVSFEKLT